MRMNDGKRGHQQQQQVNQSKEKRAREKKRTDTLRIPILTTKIAEKFK